MGLDERMTDVERGDGWNREGDLERGRQNTGEIRRYWKKQSWNRYQWSWEGWNGWGTSKEEMNLKTSEQLLKWRWREAPYSKTEVEVEIYCQEGPESLEHQGGMGHWQGTMERSLQDQLPNTGRRRQKVRKVRKDRTSERVSCVKGETLTTKWASEWVRMREWELEREREWESGHDILRMRGRVREWASENEIVREW